MRRRTNQVFRIAVAGSLAVHAIIAAVVHSHPIEAASEPPHTPATITRISLPKPTPTPVRPKPRVTQSHSRTSPIAHRPRVNLVHVTTTARGSTNVYVVPSQAPGIPEPPSDATLGPEATQAPATPSPSPTATPKPACSAPDVPARAIDAITPPAPPDAQGAQGQVKVRVDLDAQGNVTGTAPYSSSGNPLLDMAAVRAARGSRYAPEQRDCKNVPGSYLFTVDFQE